MSMSIRTNALLGSAETTQAIGRPIDTALKSISSTFAILTHDSPVICAAIKTLTIIHDLERENEVLEQFHPSMKHDQLHENDPLVAWTEHLHQEVMDVEQRKSFYLPPLDQTWAKVDNARRAYTAKHGKDDTNITPGGAVLLQYTLRIVAMKMDSLRSQLAGGSDLESLNRRLDKLKQENMALRERLGVDEAFCDRVHEMIEAERALLEAKQALEELQMARDARLSHDHGHHYGSDYT
ncbi:hypothetical protein CALCODRAFT_506403 [Calocera cornea HHB12733]|uniref:Uncharacterized protein n=1 Tax=Calocera cornea HHB12733 TaxID=1353952 RepID=A0A165J016_9BASI|nr:hypothetical protein CALCODRAFT_506403 [Calocera cornea HHB12733]